MLGAEAGLVGGSIEDWCPPQRNGCEAKMRPIEEATERVVAAVEAARRLPHDFVLVARVENGTFTFRSEATGSGQVGKLISGKS